MNTQIRVATIDDIPAMVELAEQKRTEYEQYQPRFWRKATDAREKQTIFFNKIINDQTYIHLVYMQDERIQGFVMAMLRSAPPVYDPGGLTCIIDDFVVADPKAWNTVEALLLDEAGRRAKERGAVQTVVVCGYRNHVKRAMLSALGYTIASEWYVRDI